MKLNLKGAFPKGKRITFLLLKEFLSKGGFLKPAPVLGSVFRDDPGLDDVYRNRLLVFSIETLINLWV